MYRIICKFPIPDIGNRPAPNAAVKNWYLRKIKYGLDYIRNEIQPSFKNKNQNGVNKEPNQISKTKLIELWKSNKKRAIEIVKQDCMDKAQVKCPVNKELVTEFYTEKSRRLLDEWNSNLAPWNDQRDQLNLIPPLDIDNLSLTSRLLKMKSRKSSELHLTEAHPGLIALLILTIKLAM